MGAMQAPRRVLVVDDHPVFRHGLARLIDAEPDLQVCGEAGDASEALAGVESLEPDMVVVDISLKQSSGIDLIKTLRQQSDALPVLALSVHDESLYAARAVKAGARGYIMKDRDIDDILGGIRRVLDGETVVSPEVEDQVARLAGGRPRMAGVGSLSDRELQVFELIGRGMSTRQIGEALDISVKTVATHQTRIRDKLGVRTPNELMKTAVGWLAELGTNGGG